MMSGDSNSMSVTIRCNGDGAVHALVDGVQTFCLDTGLKPGHAARLLIVVEELVTNLVEHGGIGAGGTIELAVRQEEAAILITLGDDGPPFDPRGSVAGEAVPDRGGGAGIELVRAWAEMLGYVSAEGWNRLELRMALHRDV